MGPAVREDDESRDTSGSVDWARIDAGCRLCTERDVSLLSHDESSLGRAERESWTKDREDALGH